MTLLHFMIKSFDLLLLDDIPSSSIVFSTSTILLCNIVVHHSHLSWKSHI